ncbi:MAG TPA: hypothetical protein VGF56_11215 [Rhizomicrobium sp.]|jgi:hypothetical protein
MANVVVAVGGSGAKTLEALIMLCAAGLGPDDDLTVVAIEPDKDNGNFRRAEALFDTYQRLHGFFRDSRNRLPGHSRLFRTRLRILLDGGLRWSPLNDTARGNTLAEVFQVSQMRRDPEREGEVMLIDSLYTRRRSATDAEGEQETPLDGGFRGRPPIGVAVLAGVAERDDPLFEKLDDLVSGSKEGEPPRIFFFGSIFGGTGASCIPGLARLIRGTQTRLPIGASFLLPYFGFESINEAIVAANAAEFLRQTQGSLRYYADALDQQAIFDQIFLVGSPKLSIMPDPEHYGPNQKNPPLLVELVAALAGCRFLRSTTRDDAESGTERVGYKVVSTPQVVWSDLPYAVPNAHPDEDDTALGGLGRLVRFAWAFSAVYAREISSVTSSSSQPWYRTWISDAGVDLQGATADAVGPMKNLLARFCADVLSWFGTISEPPQGDGGVRDPLPSNLTTAALFRSSQLDETGYLRLPIDRNGLLLSTGREWNDFDRLITSGKGLSLEEIFYELNGRRPRDRAQPGSKLGALVGELFDACYVHSSV